MLNTRLIGTTQDTVKLNNGSLISCKAKGRIALIGKRNGVGILYGHKVHGFIAWFFWRLYYLGNLPTIEKKLRVMADWFIDLLTPIRYVIFMIKEDKTVMKSSPTSGNALSCIRSLTGVTLF